MATKVEEVIARLRTNIPPELKKRPQWVVWRYEPDQDYPEKPRKVPYYPSDPGMRASHSDPQTWSAFEEAMHIYKLSQGSNFVFDGIGFVFTEHDPFVFIDLDDLQEDDTRMEWVSTCGSYTERSPSGKGIHIIVMGKLPVKPSGKTGRKNKTAGVEIYDRKRFSTFTGDILPGCTTIKARQKEIDSILAKYFPPRQTTVKVDVVGHGGKYTAVSLWKRIKESGQKEKAIRLYNGDMTGYVHAKSGKIDPSAADQALFNILASWTKWDRPLMFAMAEQTGLRRDKWYDHPTYIEDTTDNAIDDCTWVWNGEKRTAERFDFEDSFQEQATSEEAPTSEEPPQESQPEPEETEDNGWEVFTLADAYAPRPPIEYIVNKLIPLPSLSIFFGAPGALKSLLLQDLMACIVAGKPWLEAYRERLEQPGPAKEQPAPFATKPVPALWVDLDNGKQRTHEHIEAVSKARNLPSDAPLNYISMPNPWLDFSVSTGGAVRLAQTIKQMGAKLVIIDNLTQIIGTTNLNDSAMGVIMGNLRNLAEKFNCAVIVIHHQRKSNGNDGARKGETLMGHASIEASLDLALLIERKGDSSVVKCSTTKVRGYVEAHEFGAQFFFKHRQDTVDLAEAWFVGNVPEGPQVLQEKTVHRKAVEVLKSMGGKIKQTELADFILNEWLVADGTKPSKNIVKSCLVTLKGKDGVKTEQIKARGNPVLYWLEPI